MLRCVLVEFPKYIIYDNGSIKGPHGKFLKPFSYNGYQKIGIGGKNIPIHRLVAKAFIPNFENKPHINHKNGKKNDNRVDNLEWVTSSENCLHRYRILKKKHPMLGRKGKNNPKSKAVLQIKKNIIIKKWDSTMDAGRSIFNQCNISLCCSGKRKSHKGFQWRYV